MQSQHRHAVKSSPCGYTELYTTLFVISSSATHQNPITVSDFMTPGCTTEHKVIAYKRQFNNKAKVKCNGSENLKTRETREWK